MNYAGSFDATLSSAGQDPAPGSHVHVRDSVASHAPAGAIVVPDAHFLFNADFKRSGADLVLSKDDHELVLHDYFDGARRAALASPDGAHLTGDIVTALTGAVQYAAAAGSPAAAGGVIGHVTKLVGSATVIRNGVSIILNMGDNVEKGDVIQAGSDSTVGITFIDGTVFGLSSNARMVLNEMVYDPDGSNNSTLFNLVAGTITFVAGETAKHGDMKIGTPVATMGIRGTAVLVEIDFNAPSGSTPDCKFQVLAEPDGHTGSYVLLDKTTLQPLVVVDQAGQQINISNGIISETTAPLTPDLQKLIDDVFSLKFGQINPKTTVTFNDSVNPELTGSPIKLASGTTATSVHQVVNNSNSSSSNFQNQGGPDNFILHIDRAPTGVVTDLVGQPTTSFSLIKLAGRTSTVSGNVNFADINTGDRPTVGLTFSSFTVQNAQHQDITSTLSAQQLAEIRATEVNILVTPDPGNTNVGSVNWTYSIADNALNLLGAGDTLTLSYLVRVDNNYTPFDQSITVPITITITGGSLSETWIAARPGGGLWGDAANWETGRAPTASDDVIIMTDQSIGLTPAYPVTIDAPAFAKSVAMSDLSATPPELDNDSTLTIGGALTLSADSILHNFGTIKVGGAAEFTQQSVLGNFGTLVLGDGGDFNGESSITNTADGTIEVSGGTLNVLVDVNNQGRITVDAGATLALAAAAIDGGTVTTQGTLDLTGLAVIDRGVLVNTGQINVTGSGNALDGETIANRGTIEILDGGALTIDQGSTVGNGDGSVAVDSGGMLTLNDATITGGTVSADAGSTIDLINTGMTGVTLGGTGQIRTATGNAASTLNGVTLKSGTRVIAAADTLNLTGTIAAAGAEIDANSGPGIAVDLESLVLVGATLGGLGTIATASAANTLNGVTISDGTTVNVTDGTALDLAGTIDAAGTVALNSSGDSTQLKITGSVAIDGGGHLTLTDDANNAIVSNGPAATLRNFDTITGAGTIGDSDLALVNSGTIDATGLHPLIIDTGTNTSTAGGLVGSLLVTNNAGGVLEASAGHTLQIDGSVLNNGFIDAGNAGGSSGAVVITGNITGTGSIDIFNHAEVEIGGSVSSGQTVTFEAANGAGLLVLDDSHDFHGTIAGLTEFSRESLENHVDLRDLAYIAGHMSTHFSNGVLTISNGTDHVSLHLSGSPDPAFELASDGSDGTLVDDPLASSGTVTIGSGHTLDVSGASTATVNFSNSSGNTGELVLQDSKDFTGLIAGFAGDGTLANSDKIDLQDINFAHLTTETYVENAAGTAGTLTLSDGTNTAKIDFSGTYVLDNFKFLNDGNGGTLLVDPPVATADRFVFAPTTGRISAQHTISDFHANPDTIDLQQFTNVGSTADAVSTATQHGSDALVTIDFQDTILKDALLSSLHASDFIVTPHL